MKDFAVNFLSFDILSIFFVGLSFTLVFVSGLLHFFAVALVAVILQGWKYGLKRAAVIACVIPLMSTLLMISVGLPSEVIISDNSMFAFITLIIGLSIGKMSDMNKKLKLAREQIDELKTLIPVCATCKKIRNDEGYWENLEEYLYKHNDITFSHSVCNECAEKYYEEINQFKNKKS